MGDILVGLFSDGKRERPLLVEVDNQTNEGEIRQALKAVKQDAVRTSNGAVTPKHKLTRHLLFSEYREELVSGPLSPRE